jgi:fused signal recognition particle receptor
MFLRRRAGSNAICPRNPPGWAAADGLTVVRLWESMALATTTTAKLAYLLQLQGQTSMLAACDTFRAAAIEQLKLWGQRLNVPVVAGAYGADPSSVAHDAVSAALARKVNYLFVDTAGRLHTKSNPMQELQKLHRVLGKQLPGALTKHCLFWTRPRA